MSDHENIQPGQTLDLYIKQTCPYCTQARAYYDSHAIPYVLHDAEHDRAARDRMFAFSGGDPTVPAIVVDGTYVRSGWGDPPRG